MYVVIFRARIDQLDGEYSVTAQRLRDRALADFGCVEFVSVSEGEQEIALSYWRSLDDIQRWKADLEHQSAQHQGRSRWYQGYSVEVTEVLRGYDHRR